MRNVDLRKTGNIISMRFIKSIRIYRMEYEQFVKYCFCIAFVRTNGYNIVRKNSKGVFTR